MRIYPFYDLRHLNTTKHCTNNFVKSLIQMSQTLVNIAEAGYGSQHMESINPGSNSITA
jgi:hypothetical protein